MFSLCNPGLFVDFGDGFGRFLRAIWGKVERVCSIMFMKVVINTGNNLGIIFGNISPRA